MLHASLNTYDVMKHFFKIDFDRFEDPDESETEEDYEMINMNAVCLSLLKSVNVLILLVFSIYNPHIVISFSAHRKRRWML